MISKSKTQIMIILIHLCVGNFSQRILIAGCCSSLEAVELFDAIKVEVFGIDLYPFFYPLSAEKVEIRIGDATSLEFLYGCFDLM